MGIKKVKPTTPGRRQAKFDDFSDITKTFPEKRLVISKYICLFGLELRNLCPRLNLKDNKHGKNLFRLRCQYAAGSTGSAGIDAIL